jgi:glutathione synthase/RimK-type ligase-like ATP-grasp enzyme
MKRYLIIGDNSTVADEPERIRAFRDFLTETLGTDTKVDTVFYDELVFGLVKDSFTIVAPAKDIDLGDYQAIYLRGKRVQEYFIAKFCAVHSIPCINDYSMFYNGNKLAQTVIFYEVGVDFLPTYYAADQDLLIRYAAEHFGYPYILKANKASHGDSNYLIRNEQEAKRAIIQEPMADFIAQQYCENERDYRLLLVGDDALLFERRASTETHLNNTSKGGVAAALPLEELPEEIRSEAKLLAQELGLRIAGFDIIPRLGTNELYFLEINLQPQLRTGALLPAKQALLRTLFESF